MSGIDSSGDDNVEVVSSPRRKVGFSPESQPPAWVTRALITAAAVVGVSALAWQALWILTDLWVMLAAATFISFALDPVVSALSRRGVRRGIGTFLVGFVLFGALAAMTAMMGAVVIQQGTQLVDDLPALVDDTGEWVEATFNVDVDATRLTAADGPLANMSENMSENLTNGIVDVSAKAVGATARMLTVMLFAFYMTADAPRIRRALVRLFPTARQPQVLLALQLGISKTGSFLWSRLLLALISAAAHALLFVAAGVPYPLPVALWMGVVSQAIPVFGTYVAAAVPLLLTITVSPSAGLVVLVGIVVYQQIENSLLAPRVTGAAVDLHPLLAFGAVIAGTMLFGVVGAVLAVPAAAMLQGFVAAVFEPNPVADEDHSLLR